MFATTLTYYDLIIHYDGGSKCISGKPCKVVHRYEEEKMAVKRAAIYGENRHVTKVELNRVRIPFKKNY